MKNLNFTQKQIEDAVMSAFEIDNPCEKKIELLKLRCRIRQKEYYNVGDLESVVNEELNLMDETGKVETTDIEEPKGKKARMKVTASVIMTLLRRAGVSLKNYDTTRIAKIISFVSGYSENTIRQYLREETSFLPSDSEAVLAQAMLSAIGITEKLIV